MERITISLDTELAAEFDRLIAERGYQNRSEAVRDVLRESRVGEVEDLRAMDGWMAGNKNQHFTWGDDSFIATVACLFGWRDAQDFIWGHQRALDLLHAGSHVIEDGGSAVPAEAEAGLFYGDGAGHLAQQFRRGLFIRCERNANVAVGNNTFVLAVLLDDLLNVLRD